MRRLFDAGAEKVALETVSGNEPSERVAERLGFVRLSSHQDEHLGDVVEVLRWERTRHGSVRGTPPA